MSYRIASAILRRQMMEAAEAWNTSARRNCAIASRSWSARSSGSRWAPSARPQPPSLPPGSAGTGAIRANRERMERQKPPETSIQGMRTRGMRKGKSDTPAPRAKQGRLKLIPDAPK